MSKCVYINNTGADVSDFHNEILNAIIHDGIFTAELAEIFKLTKTPPGSGSDAEWILEFELENALDSLDE